jgi:4a-hydroxytetrahydrobiopterin dehydratase
MNNLETQHCTPCEGNTPPLSHEKSVDFLKQINEWTLLEDEAIEKTFLFENFKEAMLFVNQVAEIAEAEGHHPDINLFSWNKVTIHLSTHAIEGLSDNDFILAAKIDAIVRQK